MAEQVILDIQIPTGDVDKAVKLIGDLRGRVEALKNANKELDKSSEAYTQNTLEIKKLSKEIGTNERVLIANTKAREANEGSVEQLREQLKVVSVQWAKEAKAMGENSAEAKKLAAQKTQLTARLKEVEKQTGDTRRNVGNYSEGMREALKSSDAFNSGFANLSKTMAANPILLVVLVLDKLMAGVTKAQFIVDAFNKVLEPLNAVFERTVGIVQELIDGGLSNLVKILSDPIGAIKAFGAELGKAADQGKRLAEITIEIENAQNALIITEGKLKREFEEQKFLVEDLTLTNEERTKAAENAIKAVQDLEAQRLAVLNKEIEAAEIRASLNDTDRAAQKELNTLLAQRDEIAAQSIAQQKEVRNQLNNVQKQIAAEEKALNDQRVKDYEEAEKRKTAALEKAAQERNRIIAEEIKRNNDLYLLGVKQQLLDEEITREEYEQKLYERELELLNLQRAARVMLGQDTIAIDNQIADIKIANLKKVAAVEKKDAKTKTELKKTELDIAGDVGGSLVNITKQTAGENAAVTKAAALAQAGINIAQSITKALAEGGPIIGPILGALSAALGAVQTAKIKSVPTNNFADGVIGLQGAGTETSDSISANLSKGESVITAKATKVYAPMLADMERSVGNNPNYQLGNRRFARGIIAAGNMPATNTGRAMASDALQFAEAMRQMKVFVSLTELNEKQDELSAAKSFANIVE